VKQRLGEEMNFRGYCCAISLGHTSCARMARIVLMMEGRTPRLMRKECDRDLKTNRIDYESFTVRMDAIDELEGMYQRGEQTHVIDTSDGKQWRELAPGCHQRIDHTSRRTGGAA